MKLLRKMLLVLLFLSMVLPVSAAPETEKAKENVLPAEMQCPECRKKFDLAKELKKISKNQKKAKKNKKKKKSKKKNKDAGKNVENKEQEEKKPALPKSIKCPKCKKPVKLPLPENEKNAEADKKAGTLVAEENGNGGEE